jgi:perosamine synthetase
MTTGEGGMAVTADADLASRMRQMSLHGLSNDAWNRYTDRASWDYRIVAPGFKYNLTDIAACLGTVQLQRVEDMRCQRERIADFYREQLQDLEQIELPPPAHNRIHSWHLFPIRLCLDRLAINRDEFMQKLQENGVGCSVHWRPLHLHPYYDEFFGWRAGHLPVATAVWQRLISLPLFPSMDDEEQDHVIQVVRELCHRYAVGNGQPVNGRPKPR